MNSAELPFYLNWWWSFPRRPGFCSAIATILVAHACTNGIPTTQLTNELSSRKCNLKHRGRYQGRPRAFQIWKKPFNKSPMARIFLLDVFYWRILFFYEWNSFVRFLSIEDRGSWKPLDNQRRCKVSILGIDFCAI